MKPMISTLEAAISSGTEIDIIYQGGSNPGAVRTVMPLRIADGLLKARDPATGLNKSYKLELITLPEKDAAAAYEPPFRHYHSLLDLLLLEQDLILRTDLFVLADRFHIQLFKSEKDSLSAAPLLSIGYQKYRQTSPSDGYQNKKLPNSENPKPWICNGIAYAGLQQAAETFVKALRDYIARKIISQDSG